MAAILWTLATQRRRWERGLGEVLWTHKRMLWNPRYGVVGLLGTAVFLDLRVPGRAHRGLRHRHRDRRPAARRRVRAVPDRLHGGIDPDLDPPRVLGILLEEYAIRRYTRRADIRRLVLFSLLEAFGYRQLTAFWRSQAMIDLARGRKDWGKMPRRGLERPTEAPPAPKARA